MYWKAAPNSSHIIGWAAPGGKKWWHSILETAFVHQHFFSLILAAQLKFFLVNDNLMVATFFSVWLWILRKYQILKTKDSRVWNVVVCLSCVYTMLSSSSSHRFNNTIYFSCIFILLRIPVSCISQQRTKQLRLPSKQLTLNIVSFIVLFISRWQFQAGLITAGYQCSVLYRMVRLYNTSLLPPAADCSDQATTMSKNFYNDSFPSSACSTAKTGWRGRWLLQPTVIF